MGKLADFYTSCAKDTADFEEYLGLINEMIDWYPNYPIDPEQRKALVDGDPYKIVDLYDNGTNRDALKNFLSAVAKDGSYEPRFKEFRERMYIKHHLDDMELRSLIDTGDAREIAKRLTLDGNTADSFTTSWTSAIHVTSAASAQSFKA
jgi:hypothetical protein